MLSSMNNQLPNHNWQQSIKRSEFFGYLQSSWHRKNLAPKNYCYAIFGRILFANGCGWRAISNRSAQMTMTINVQTCCVIFLVHFFAECNDWYDSNKWAINVNTTCAAAIVCEQPARFLRLIHLEIVLILRIQRKGIEVEDYFSCLHVVCGNNSRDKI